MFEKEIEEYEALLKVYREKVTDRMAIDDLKEYNEILFSAHSCAIEGNSFSVNDTRELKEKGLGVIPRGKTLFEAFEMLDHFRAYEFLFNQPEARDGVRVSRTLYPYDFAFNYALRYAVLPQNL
jgi:Fic family protein